MAAGAGLGLYIFAVRHTVTAIQKLWPQRVEARSVVRTIWISATVGAAVAALTYSGPTSQNFNDAVLEIGGASFPLLFIPFREGQPLQPQASTSIPHSRITIVLSGITYGIFVASLGRGITTQ